MTLSSWASESRPALRTRAGRCGPVARLRGRDRGHRGGLHQTGRMRGCAGDAHGLERVAFVQALAQATDLSGRALAGLVDEFDNGRRDCTRDGRLDGVKAGRDPRTDTGQATDTV